MSPDPAPGDRLTPPPPRDAGAAPASVASTSCDAPLLRPARADDVEQLVALTQAAYRGEGGWTTEAHLVGGARTDADEVRAMLEDPSISLIVAEEGATLHGCCYTHREPADEHGIVRAELGLFAVAPSAQGRGLGGRLLEAQAAALRADGVDVLMIRVLQSRPELHAWYLRRGFVPVGRSVPFPGNPAELKVAGLGMDVMERELHPARD